MNLIFSGIIYTVLLLAFFAVMLFSLRGKRFILYFDSDRTCKIIKSKVKDGTLEIGKKKFVLKDFESLLLSKPLFGVFPLWFPFYVLHYASTEPLKLDRDSINAKGYSPEKVKAFTKMGALKSLMESNPGQSKKEFWIYISVGMAVGFFACLSFVSMKIIPIK